jgi:hypothetical protein
LSWSWRRATGVAALKARVARATGVPLSRAGLERKVGRSLLEVLLRLFSR